jgi:hypothetical protein
VCLQREEVTGGWRKIHNEELHNLYSLPNIIRIIKEDDIGGLYGIIEAMRKTYENLNERSEGQGVDGRTILKWILKEES